jgi:hypothetical protein
LLSVTDKCPIPPPEHCCTHLIERPGAQLRVRFAGEARALSSITLWDKAGGALGASAAHLGSATINVGYGQSMTGCFLGGPSAVPPPAGYQGREIVCGAAGDQVVLSFPGVLTAGQGKVFIRLCTVPAGAAGRATLLVKTSA